MLDQTINIGISENVKTSLEECAIVIKPELEDIQLLDFAQKKEIIKTGGRSREEILFRIE